MEQFTTLKRRTTDLLQNAQQTITLPNLPNLPNLPALPALPALPTTISLPKLQLRRQSQPQNPVNGTWQRIHDAPRLPRSSHSINIVDGSAYIFGGENNANKAIDNDLHVVRLPLSGGSTDYYRTVAVAAEATAITQATNKPMPPSESSGSLDEVTLETPLATIDKGKALAFGDTATLGGGSVPEPRVGHATATIGSRIFVFGGRGGPDSKPLEEAGRVWVFDTRTKAWAHLDPVPAVKGGAIVPHPAPRSHHCAAAVDSPREFGGGPAPKEPQNWREWAMGDISNTGIPQDPVVGHVAENAVDEEEQGFGTFFIHGGCLANNERTCDFWAFDVRSRTWTELPAAPGPARSGAAICINKDRVFRFGGFDGSAEIGGQLDFLDIEFEAFIEGAVKTEGSARAKGSWHSILQEPPSADSSPEWPSPRSFASLHSLTIAGARDYLIVSFGQESPSPDGEAAAGKLLTDVWAFSLPSLGMNAAGLTAAFMSAVGRKTDDGKWIKVATLPYDDEEDDSLPAARGWLASAPMTDLEETGVLIWGGRSENSSRLGDCWILRLS